MSEGETDRILAEADAEYAALPGMPPDGYSFLSEADIGDDRDDYYRAHRECCQKWQAEGMTFYRATEVGGEFWPNHEPGVWLEFWKVQPHKQAEFNPPVVSA